MDNKYIAWADIKGTKYPLCLSIGSSAALEEAFGSVTGVVNCIAQHADNNEISELMRSILKAARPLAQAGQNYLTGTALLTGQPIDDIPEFPADEVLSTVLSANEMLELWTACLTAMRVGSAREVEVAKDNSPKNAENAM